MKSLRALKPSYANGILRSLADRSPVAIADLVRVVPREELFKGPTKTLERRAYDLLVYARDLGLAVVEQREVAAITDAGREYVDAGDPGDPWTVTAEQAAVLRRLLLANRDSAVYDGVARALSLMKSANGSMPTPTLFGRALAKVGEIATWDSEQTLRSQALRYQALLEEMGLVDSSGVVTAVGDEILGRLDVPKHPPLAELIDGALRLKIVLRRSGWYGLVNTGRRSRSTSIRAWFRSVGRRCLICAKPPRSKKRVTCIARHMEGIRLGA